MERLTLYNNVYKDKTVLVTGHTGFKGAWLITWLNKLGAKVIGISKDVPTQPAMVDIINILPEIVDYRVDIRNYEEVFDIFQKHRPDFVFHLAAQPIVSLSYREPLETITSNVIGTTHILESLRHVSWPITAVIITSDKAYDNVEQVWGYREVDALGGKDIYSGSKGAAELVIKSYFYSFFKDSPYVSLGVGRAGNVIGGGDWAKDRIVVDCMLAWSKQQNVEIRSPNATRPWQHVLEPISGYLHLGQSLYENKDRFHGEAFNFGPLSEQNRTVLELINDLAVQWGFENISDAYYITKHASFSEASLLKLNCDKALFYMGWHAVLEYRQTIALTALWYKSYYMQKNKDMYTITLEQIKQYEEIALKKSLPWTRYK